MKVDSKVSASTQKSLFLGSKTTIASSNLKDYPVLSSTGISLRKQRQGPENKLVNEYISANYYFDSFSFLVDDFSEEEKILVFVEPKIGSSFPDIVIVCFDVAASKEWPFSRMNLSSYDLKVLHCIFSNGRSSELYLRKIFPSRLRKSIQNLEAAGVVKSFDGEWEAEPLEEIFAVKRLIAIEAKVHDWERGVKQAFLNTWFTSESYLLMPRIPNSDSAIARAKHFGIGIIEGYKLIQKDSSSEGKDYNPKSYASWLFNEWAWKSGLTV